MKEFVIIVQGKSENVEKIKKSWYDCPLIFSTWDGEQDKYKNSDISIFSKFPEKSGIHNLNYQHTSTINGLKLAKSMGYKKAVKWRGDMIPTNPKKLLQSFIKPINFFCWHYTGKYLCDYFMAGDIDILLDFWDFPLNVDYSFPEQAITKNYFKKYEKFKNNYCMYQDLDETNDIYWIKNNIYLSTYKNEICYKGSFN